MFFFNVFFYRQDRQDIFRQRYFIRNPFLLLISMQYPHCAGCILINAYFLGACQGFFMDTTIYMEINGNNPLSVGTTINIYIYIYVQYIYIYI